MKLRKESQADHKEKGKKKAVVALRQIFHPFTLLPLFYVGFLIYNTVQLRKDKWDIDKRIEATDPHDKVVEEIITIIVVLLLVILDVYLKI